MCVSIQHSICSIMVMKAAAGASFFKMRGSWFETHNAFCKGICITFFHSLPMWADHQDGVYCSWPGLGLSSQRPMLSYQKINSCQYMLSLAKIFTEKKTS